MVIIGLARCFLVAVCYLQTPIKDFFFASEKFLLISYFL